MKTLRLLKVYHMVPVFTDKALQEDKDRNQSAIAGLIPSSSNSTILFYSVMINVLGKNLKAATQENFTSSQN